MCESGSSLKGLEDSSNLTITDASLVWVLMYFLQCHSSKKLYLTEVITEVTGPVLL